MILYCAAFTSALGRTAEKLSYSWCHLVTFEACFWCLIILCLFFTCDLIFILMENTVTFPVLSSFVSLLKVIFFQCSQGRLGVQLTPPCRNICRNSPQTLCPHKSGDIEAMLLLYPCQTIVPVTALGGEWQHPEES